VENPFKRQKPRYNVMKNRPICCSFLILLILVCLSPISAFGGAGFRCGGRIIDVGNTRDYVLHQCGEPSNKEERTERLATNFRTRYPEDLEGYNYILNENRIEVWTYNLGPTQFIRYLTFRNGKLIKIKTGDYGY
jgi:hypothetical protein